MTMKLIYMMYVFFIFESSCAYMNLRMTKSNYLDSITSYSKPEINTSNVMKLINKQIDNSVFSPLKEIHIDSIFMNVYQIDNISFKPNNDFISFKLKNKIENIYYVEHNNVYKVSNNTKISSNAIRNFLVYEMDSNQNVNCVIFNSKK
jgi:hypothetical protein